MKLYHNNILIINTNNLIINIKPFVFNLKLKFLKFI